MRDLNANTESREQLNTVARQLQSHSIIHDGEQEGKSTCGAHEYFLMSRSASADHFCDGKNCTGKKTGFDASTAPLQTRPCHRDVPVHAITPA